MEENQAIIEFTSDDGSTISFFVLEQVKIAGVNYILVTDSDTGYGEEDAYILKELREEDGEGIYEMLGEENFLPFQRFLKKLLRM